jgi:hypothetical protein
MSLADHADPSTHIAWPSVPTMAYESGCSESTAREALRELERIGLIVNLGPRKGSNNVVAYLVVDPFIVGGDDLEPTGSRRGDNLEPTGSRRGDDLKPDTSPPAPGGKPTGSRSEPTGSRHRSTQKSTEKNTGDARKLASPPSSPETWKVDKDRERARKLAPPGPHLPSPEKQAAAMAAYEASHSKSSPSPTTRKR